MLVHKLLFALLLIRHTVPHHRVKDPREFVSGRCDPISCQPAAQARGCVFHVRGTAWSFPWVPLACAAGWHDVPDANAVDANMRPRGKMFDRRPFREVGAQFTDDGQCMNFINAFNRRRDSWRAGCVSTLILPLSCAMYMDGDCLIEIEVFFRLRRKAYACNRPDSGSVMRNG